MSLLNTLLFIIVTTNAGGQAKSAVARLCKSLFRMLDEPVILLDGDPGNGTSLHLDKKEGEGFTWGVTKALAPQMFDAYAGSHVVVDCGANQWASAREVNELVPELAKLFGAAGYRNIALLPFTPNKRGAAETLQELEPKLPPMEKIYVRADTDGSGDFEGLEAGKKVVNFGHLPPGFFSYLNDKAPVSFYDVVEKPEPDRTLAGRYIGRWMHDFAKETSKYELFASAVPILGQVPVEPNVRFSVMRQSDCTDEALGRNQYRTAILNDIDAYGWTPDGLRKAADELEQRLA